MADEFLEEYRGLKVYMHTEALNGSITNRTFMVKLPDPDSPTESQGKIFPTFEALRTFIDAYVQAEAKARKLALPVLIVDKARWSAGQPVLVAQGIVTGVNMHSHGLTGLPKPQGHYDKHDVYPRAPWIADYVKETDRMVREVEVRNAIQEAVELQDSYYPDAGRRYGDITPSNYGSVLDALERDFNAKVTLAELGPEQVAEKVRAQKAEQAR